MAYLFPTCLYYTAKPYTVFTVLFYDNKKKLCPKTYHSKKETL